MAFDYATSSHLHNHKVGYDFHSTTSTADYVHMGKPIRETTAKSILGSNAMSWCRDENFMANKVTGDKKAQHNNGVDELTDALRSLSLDKATWQRLAEMVGSHDAIVRAEGVKTFQLLLSVGGESPIQDVVNCGVIPIFVRLINEYINDDSALSVVYNAAWSLTNIASGSTEQTQVVVESGCIKSFLNLVDSQKEELKEQGLWGLGNIAGDRCIYRDTIMQCDDAMLKIVNALKTSSNMDTIRTGVWMISNLCRGKPRAPFRHVMSVIPYLSSIVLYSSDFTAISDACWALDGIGESSEGVSAIVRSGIITRLMQLIEHPQPTVKRPALRITGQIATGTASQTEALITAGIIPLLINLLRSRTKSLRKDACWTISNIAAGTKSQLQALSVCGAFPILVDIFHNDEELEVKKEASWAITNACTIQDESHIEYLIEIGCISPVCEILLADEYKILEVTLDAMHNMLSFGARRTTQLGLPSNPCVDLIVHTGGVTRLLALQKTAESSGNFTVWQKAGALLQMYFAGCMS